MASRHIVTVGFNLNALCGVTLLSRMTGIRRADNKASARLDVTRDMMTLLRNEWWVEMKEDRLFAIRERMWRMLRSKNDPNQNSHCEPENRDSIPSAMDKDASIPWMLEEWRRISIPDWRRILHESIESKDKQREDYARWMLREVLQDQDYKETER